MINELKAKTEKWKSLERKTLAQRQKAEEYYEKNLMKLIVSDYISRNSAKVYEKVDYLIVSVGTSYEPIVLNIELFKPERILFLYTDKSEAILDKVVKFCELKTANFEKSKVSEVDALDIYREIKKCYLTWGKPKKLYVDFTGGTKAMSAAAALAGAMIEVQLVYVGSEDYLADFRKPNPGSEILTYIENPLTVFGDLEIEKAITLFGRNNYAGATEKLEYLKESIPDPNIRTQLNFLYLLSKAYEAWDALEFQNAYEQMRVLTSQLYRDRRQKHFMLMAHYPKLKKQEQILECLTEIPELIKNRNSLQVLQQEDTIFALMFTMFQSALIREKQEKYDMATLLFYRLLEMIEQRRLSRYNLFVSKMDYVNMIPKYEKTPEYEDKKPSEKVAILKNEVRQLRHSLFGKHGNDYLAEQVSLLDGFVILAALKDEIVAESDGNNTINLLKRIRAMVYLRNNSIFAHGLGPVAKAEYLKFSGFVTDMLIRFCEIEGIDFEQYKSDIAWINPVEGIKTGGGEVKNIWL